MTIYAYIRVSTDSQDVANQKHGVTEYANKMTLTPLNYIEDTVSSKKNWQDRKIGELLKTAKPNDVLIVSEISRLARSTLQVLEILQTTANNSIIVHITKNNMIMDNSLNSKITAVVLGLAAEIEREFISARTTEALARRKAQGLPMGRPKGAKSKKKLDNQKELIKTYLAKGVNKTEICKIVDCHSDTLAEWLRANDLERYINPRSNKKVK